MEQLRDMFPHGARLGATNFKFVQKLIIREPPEDGHSIEFHHLAIYHLAKWSPYLHTLWIFGNAAETKAKACHFLLPVSMPMQLRQFHQLTELSLSDYCFASIWDLRRLIISPPSLSSLRLRNISWPELAAAEKLPLPSLLFTTRKLASVEVENCALFWDVVLFWTTTTPHSQCPEPTCDRESGLYGHADPSYPSLTAEDAMGIRQLLQTCMHSTKLYEFAWTQDKGNPSGQSIFTNCIITICL